MIIRQGDDYAGHHCMAYLYVMVLICFTPGQGRILDLMLCYWRMKHNGFRRAGN